MKKRIYQRMLLLTVLASFITCGAMFFLRWRAGIEELNEQTSRQAAIAAAGYLCASDKAQALQAIGESDTSRITLIAQDGTVLYDSHGQVGQMENHQDRPEVLSAMVDGVGSEVRVSQTLGRLTCYVALQLPNGEILRVANGTDWVTHSIVDTVPAMLLVLCLIVVVSMVVSARLTEHLVQPINNIDLSHPMEQQIYEELSPLLYRLDAQNEQIAMQMEMLRRKQVEFEAITAEMDEGLVVLNEQGVILTSSRAAGRLLQIRLVSGIPMDVLEQDETLRKGLAQAQAGQSGVYTQARAGRQLRLSCSPVLVDGQVRGVVLLVLDISAQFEAEQSRRTFTANVTHELKTPLTSVLGYAEMIRYGLAQPADVPDFATRIHEEAARLLALVDDIMKLSRLDEGRNSLTFAPIDLYALTQSVCQRMQERAAHYQVTVLLDGQSCWISGVSSMVDEVISNLCDNAIKYNFPKGVVKISIQQQKNCIIWEIFNTGAGIPAYAQAHIFERFYRADASRSQEIPGTGLGLAIVKHICEIHQAEITVQSNTEGTTFRVAWREQ